MIKKLFLLAALMLLAGRVHAFSFIPYLGNNGTISSGTITNFNASSATITAETATTINASTTTTSVVNYNIANANGNQTYSLLYSSTVFDCSTSTNTTGSYVPTKTAIKITPHSTTSRIEITVAGILQTAAAQTSSAEATLFRNSTNLNPSTGDKSFCYLDMSATGALQAPCVMNMIDLPASISQQTYTVEIENTASTTNISWGGAASCNTITVKEWSY